MNEIHLLVVAPAVQLTSKIAHSFLPSSVSATVSTSVSLQKEKPRLDMAGFSLLPRPKKMCPAHIWWEAAS